MTEYEIKLYVWESADSEEEAEEKIRQAVNVLEIEEVKELITLDLLEEEK